MLKALSGKNIKMYFKNKREKTVFYTDCFKLETGN